MCWRDSSRKHNLRTLCLSYVQTCLLLHEPNTLFLVTWCPN